MRKNIHFLDIGKTKRLSREEEITLFRVMNAPFELSAVNLWDKAGHLRMMKDSAEAKELLARQLIPMVIKFAGSYANEYNSSDDMIAEGMVILARCIGKWKEHYGCRLSTLFVRALWWDIVRIRAGNYLIRVPRNADQGIGILSSCYAELDNHTVTRIYDEEHGLNEETELQQSILNEAFEKLSDREQLVLKERLRSTPLTEIGNQLGVTKERIRQLEKQGMQRLQTAIYSVADQRGYPIETFDILSVYEVLKL